ncbi:MAG: hypothetical protein ALECFALPRED_008519 [Alectoria fallacina]|uniref:Uncharacterized protein n=1 Tax=Alectoria fallacina TaxID=1903189 RepID=A0A8H3J4F5_9LECA|nr:MAG: hypothetical protein ALECFALPRED_008519 [Alectoria fallacina]
MRYSFALVALSTGSAVMAGLANELSDGQVQEQVSAASAPTPVAEATAFSTVDTILTSCAPTVKNCPALKTPAVVPAPFVSTPSPNEAGASSTYSVGPPVLASPSPSIAIVPVPAQAGSTGSAKAPAPVVPVPVAPAASSPAACSTCPSCSPVTVYLTVTATPTPAAAASTGSPSIGESGASGSPSIGESGASGSPSIGESGASGSASPSGKLPPSPGSPVVVPAGGAAGVAAPSGTAPSGTAPSGTASTGAVKPPSATSSPISSFKGAANTVGSSMAVAGLAAFAAIFLA